MIFRNFIIVFFIEIVLVTEVLCKKPEFGESCGPQPQRQCDPDFSLVCSLGRCGCPTGSYRDIASQSCYAKADSVCALPTEETSHPLRCTPDSNCIATSGTNMTCVCIEGFQANNDGKCVLGQYGQPCDPQRDKCDSSQYLICGSDNHCRCSPSSVYLDGKCHCLRGASCALFAEPCIPKSSCEGPTGNKTCICFGGNVGNNGRYSPMCELSFGEPCTVWPDLCDTSNFLQCRKFPSVCSCNVTLNDTYEDMNNGNCYLLHGRNCTTDKGSKQCHPNSKCTLVDKDTNLKQCLCQEGFSPNEKELCFLPYQGSCDRNNDLCDSDSHLSCSAKGVCECSDPSMWFDQREGICKILVGYSCKRFGAGRPMCVNNSLCLDGVCKCRNNYNYKFEVGPDRQCYLPFGASCTPGNDIRDHCSPYQRLNCNFTTIKCDCNDKKNSIFNVETESCFSLVGAKCTDSEHCFPNSYCKKPYGESDGICSCNAPLSLNKERKCFLTNFGDQCQADMDLCDPSSFLYCQASTSHITNLTISQCSCSINHKMYYDNELQECRLKAGTTCNPSLSKNNKDPKCGPRMICDNDDYTCRCQSPYSKNKQGKCILNMGQNCDKQNDNCDAAEFLKCDNGLCGCGKDALFDRQLGKCVIHLGGHCSLDFHSNHLQQCVENTTCGSTDYRCSCKDGYEPVNAVNKSHSYCLKSFNSSCSSDDDCNIDNHLVCIKKRCRCSGDYIEYDPEQNSSHQYSSSYNWIIKCLPTYNISCSEDLPCHPSLSLQCSNGAKGKSCSCFNSPDYVYNHERKACFGLTGAICVSDDACVDGAYCARQNGTKESFGACKCLSSESVEDRTCEYNALSSSRRNAFNLNLFLALTLFWAMSD